MSDEFKVSHGLESGFWSGKIKYDKERNYGTLSFKNLSMGSGGMSFPFYSIDNWLEIFNQVKESKEYKTWFASSDSVKEDE